MRKNTYEIFLLALIGLGLIASFIGLIDRWNVESKYRTVTIAIDYFQLHRFARYNGIDIDSLLDELKKEDFTTIALLEDTPEFLEERNLAAVVKGFTVEKKVLEGPGSKEEKEKPEIRFVTEDKLEALLYQLEPNRVHVILNNQESFIDKLYESWVDRLGRERVELRQFTDRGLQVISLDGDPEHLYQLGAGFVTPLLDELRARGFHVIPRIRNVRSIDAGQISSIIANLDFPYCAPLIFDGDEVLGYPSALKTTADAIRNSYMMLGYVEFAKQDGDKTLGGMLPDRLARVHSISDEEMEVYTPSKATARMIRAVRERNVRVVYLKPFMLAKPGQDLLKTNLDYFKSVRDGLVADGFKIGYVKPLQKNSPNIIIKLLIMLAFASGLALLLSWGWGIRSIPGVLILLVIFAILSLKSPESIFIKTGGLIAGIAFPMLGLAYIFSKKAEKGTYPHVVVSFILTLLFTIIGGLMTAALFATPSYMTEMDAFSGVKLSFVVPVFLAALIGVRLFFREEKSGFFNELIFLGNLEIKIKHLAFLAVVAFAGLILLMRSGNEPIFAVSDIESSFRGVLETIFAVRPRTKEFLIGHPLLILAFYTLRARPVKLSSLAFICLVGGIIGQISIFNTFCHFHTPIMLSVWRTIIGLVLGSIGGLILICCLWFILKFTKKK